MPRISALHTTLLALAMALCGGAQAQMNEALAKQVAQEVRILINEGTGVIGALQPQINAGKATAAEVKPEVLVEQFKARYQKAAGVPFDTSAPGVLGDARRAYLQAFSSVVTRYQSNLIKGGQDAFVPAFFRAQTMKAFNTAMQGSVKAYATNRDNELINGDWAVSRVMKGSPLAAEVTKRMGTGGLDADVTRVGNTVMGYYPMKLAQGCVACHAQNGLKQTVGAFGGVLVAEIPVK
ncbi:MAG TPA: hypothetical protein VFV84_13430 [Burkholderiales bacterium]|nr:hypothetical protein [Burkholderiales bacterium]